MAFFYWLDDNLHEVGCSQQPSYLVWQKCGVFAMIIPSQAGVRVSVGELAYARENVLTRSRTWVVAATTRRPNH
jgi:hypothetical protein